MPQKEIQQQQFINQYMAEKAGMTEVDKNKIAEVVQKITEGTPKYLYDKEMNEKRSIQLAQMLKKVFEFSKQQKRQMKISWQRQIEVMRKNRNLDRYWAHLDFDMFYVACEMLDKPQLKHVPCAVGGENSVLCTANYEARKYGVRSALPTFIAKQLCPELILIPPNFTKYKRYSEIFRNYLRQFDPELQSMGLDEAFIDITSSIANKNDDQKEEFITNIREEIFSRTGLTVSCGIGANKMLAKLASQQRKPNGQYIIPNNEYKILDYMAQKRIRKIPGIGPVNEYFLKGLGMQTTKDILNNTDLLAICFSTTTTQFYISRSLGLGSIQHEVYQRKSLGRTQTFKATNDLLYLQKKVLQICEQVSMQLEERGYVSKSVVFVYQTQMYSKKDKTFQLNKFTSEKESMLQKIIPFLREFYSTKKEKIRLLGARCTNLLRIEDLRKIQLDKYLKPQSQLLQLQQSRSKTTTFFCPICDLQIQCNGNLASFNRHIDKCMLADIKEKGQQPQRYVQEERNLNVENNKRGTLLAYFNKQ